MKCPELYHITQSNYKKPIVSDENVLKGELSLLIETKYFGECYKEDCMAYDKENDKCKLLENEEK